jgi:hypothetical protein
VVGASASAWHLSSTTLIDGVVLILSLFRNGIAGLVSAGLVRLRRLRASFR